MGEQGSWVLLSPSFPETLPLNFKWDDFIRQWCLIFPNYQLTDFFSFITIITTITLCSWLHKRISKSEIQLAQIFVNWLFIYLLVPSKKINKQKPNKPGILTIRSHAVSEERDWYVEKKWKIQIILKGLWFCVWRNM